MTEQPLLNATDFAKFKAKDQDWFLGAVGESVRDYCGWHIAPIKVVTDVPAIIGNHGIIMLPTLNLVSIEGLRLNGAELSPEVWQAFSGGYIEYYGFAGRRARGHRVWVDMTHGFDALPKAVAEVGYELTGRTMEKPSGVVKHMTRGPTDLDFLEFGAVLSDDQKSRLGPYRVTRI